MIINLVKKAFIKIAAEVHKTKIEEFEKRILEIEQKQAVILKTIQDNEKKLGKLDDRLYQANMESAAAVGAINTLIQSGIQGNRLLNQSNNNNE